jgi:hypothetical protein
METLAAMRRPFGNASNRFNSSGNQGNNSIQKKAIAKPRDAPVMVPLHMSKAFIMVGCRNITVAYMLASTGPVN